MVHHDCASFRIPHFCHRQIIDVHIFGVEPRSTLQGNEESLYEQSNIKSQRANITLRAKRRALDPWFVSVWSFLFSSCMLGTHHTLMELESNITSRRCSLIEPTSFEHSSVGLLAEFVFSIRADHASSCIADRWWVSNRVSKVPGRRTISP